MHFLYFSRYIHIYSQENESSSLDPIYLAVEDYTIGGPLKLHSLVEVPIALIAAYYTFSIQYPAYCNVHPFLEAVFFYNNHMIKGKVVVHKVIAFLQQSPRLQESFSDFGFGQLHVSYMGMH